METVTLISVSEAAAVLNRSVSTISRALSDGRLHYACAQRRLIQREGLEARFARSTRPRIDHPVPRPPAKVLTNHEWWEAVADKLNGYLDPSCGLWPRLTGPQLAVFVGCVQMAADSVDD